MIAPQILKGRTAVVDRGIVTLSLGISALCSQGTGNREHAVNSHGDDQSNYRHTDDGAAELLQLLDSPVVVGAVENVAKFVLELHAAFTHSGNQLSQKQCKAIVVTTGLGHVTRAVPSRE